MSLTYDNVSLVNKWLCPKNTLLLSLRIGVKELGVELNMFEEEKYKAIKAVHNGQMTKERAEVKLDLSRRHINRLVKKI